MLGAIIGDIAGSRWEFNPTNSYNFQLFSEKNDFTDDTICTIAVADAILQGKNYGESIHEWCRSYPHPMGAYGARFKQWVMSNYPMEPYKDEDWSGKRRTVYYMDMEVTHMIHPDRCPLLTSEILTKEIPDYVWTGGHSGQLLNDEQAKKLDALWNAYLNGNLNIFEIRAAKLVD